MKDFLLVAIPFIAVATLALNLMYPGAVDKLGKTFVTQRDYDKMIEKLLADHEKILDPVGYYANHNDPYMLETLKKYGGKLDSIEINMLRRAIYQQEMYKRERLEENKSWTENDDVRLKYLNHRLNILLRRQMEEIRKNMAPVSYILRDDEDAE